MNRLVAITAATLLIGGSAMAQSGGSASGSAGGSAGTGGGASVGGGATTTAPGAGAAVKPGPGGASGERVSARPKRYRTRPGRQLGEPGYGACPVGIRRRVGRCDRHHALTRTTSSDGPLPWSGPSAVCALGEGPHRRHNPLGER